jgi:hypothetical protein
MNLCKLIQRINNGEIESGFFDAVFDLEICKKRASDGVLRPGDV